MSLDPSIDAFNKDASEHGGYLYTKNPRLSVQLATQTTTDLILRIGRFEGRKVLDMACGDGYYTRRFWDLGRPKAMTGVDMADKAIAVAEAAKEGRPIQFQTADVHHLPFPDDSFDLALVQSVLHHDDDPASIIREAFRVAPEVLIHEPNGFNLGLKIIEKVSRYHREHGERSYTFPQIAEWIQQSGGEIVRHEYAGFVAMFSPDWMARIMKLIEPVVIKTPCLRRLGSAVVALVARRAHGRGKSQA